MKFEYQYRTSDNVVHSGRVGAATRELAFQILKAKGIRPFKVEAVPGFVNWALGCGKRWIAIVLLCLLVVSLYVALQHAKTRRDAESAVEFRSQIYGDPGVISEASANGWAAVFSDAGDRFLAQHAIPARMCNCRSSDTSRAEIVAALESCRRSNVLVQPMDLDEVRKIKRMVNGMKAELNRYVSSGGTVEGYVDRLDLRLMTEVSLFTRIKAQIDKSDDADFVRSKNAELRAMGLPMVNIADDKNL